MSTWPFASITRDELFSGEGTGVRVAIIDSGYGGPRAPDALLAHRIAIVRRHDRFEATDDRGGDSEYALHGTHVCDIVRAIAPGAVLGMFTVRDRRLPEAIACAAQCAMALGYQILNCSIAASGKAEVLQIYKQWIDLAYTRGVHLVAAAHNRHSNEVWPAWFPSVVAVTRRDHLEGEDLVYAPVGTPPLAEFAACGRTISPTAGPVGNSFAAPRVAGLLARLVANCPDISPLEAKTMLRRVGPTKGDQRRSHQAVPRKR